MTIRGMKQGLAVSAVSALVVTGVPFFAGPAVADPLAPPLDTAVALLTQFGGSGSGTAYASTKFDGQDSSIHLLASAATGVTQVRFAYRLASDVSASYVDIAASVSRNNDGAFSYDWTPESAVLGQDIYILAQSLDGTLGQSESKQVHVDATSASVNLDDANPIALFDQPYGTLDPTGDVSDYLNQKSDLAIVSGTTSSASGVTLRRRGATGVGFRQAVVGTAGPVTRPFTGVVNLGTYHWGPGIVHQVAVGANLGTTGSDDVEAYMIEKQTIAAITAVPAKALLAPGETTSVTATVTDSLGRPVPGAEVFREGNLSSPLGYTNEVGQVTDTGVGIGSFRYYANTTIVDRYEPAVDFRTAPVVIGSTVGSATAAADTAAYDVDETGKGEVTVTVKDPAGGPVNNQRVDHSWSFLPFSGAAGSSTPAANMTTGPAGTVTVPVPDDMGSGSYTLHAYLNLDGSPGQQSGDMAVDEVTIKAGESEIAWDGGPTAQVPSGTSNTFTGGLRLEDGTPLSGRSVTVGYSAAGGGNAALTTTPTVTTSPAGSFSAAVSDPDPAPTAGEPSELGGRLRATALALRGTGDVAAADASGDLQVNFVAPPRGHISAALSLANNRRGNDVALVNAPSTAARARVKLFKIRSNGSRSLVAVKTAGRTGNVSFVVADSRKRSFTTYQAYVGSTPLTFADWTPRRRIR